MKVYRFTIDFYADTKEEAMHKFSESLFMHDDCSDEELEWFFTHDNVMAITEVEE